ncbi:MAG: DNA-binding transcriptional LysR family regulator [Candidatus Azotimanducaceae bacterium]
MKENRKSINQQGLSGRIADTDIRLLRIYKAVVECGGFSAAEADLNISRAAISMAIADLETRLSLKLCSRGRAGFSLTDQGREVYLAVLQLHSALEDFKTQVNGIHAQLKGELNIGITDNLVTMPKTLITNALRDLKIEGPEVVLNIRMSPPGEIEIAILDGQLHVGVVPILKPLSGLEYIPLYEEESLLYCSNTHPLFTLPDSEIQKIDLGSYDAVLPTYAQRTDIRSQNRQLNGTASASDREGIAFLILTGQYIGYLPTHFAERWLLTGRIRALLPGKLNYISHYGLITRKIARPNRILDSFLGYLALS